MPHTDEFGTVVFDPADTAPFRAWAILELGQIDRDRVFLDKAKAVERATLELNTADDVVPVVVTGDKVELAG